MKHTMDSGVPMSSKLDVADMSSPTSYTARQIATVYGCPVDQFDGMGVTIGIIQLGGALNQNDFAMAGLGPVNVTVVSVDGARPVSSDADGEVALDTQVVAGVAPGVAQRVYFAPNTEQGFLHAVAQAVKECSVVSISWGGPESDWSAAGAAAMSAVLANARAGGVAVFVASGDSGSKDGASVDTTDYPASDPHVVGCGGTRLLVTAKGLRSSEVAWHNPGAGATGGGVSRRFPGRQVPDVAGNADPRTGYHIMVNGTGQIVGGTSAVAPLYAAMTAILMQAYGHPFDFLNSVLTNPSVCFDVTIGDNGSYKAGPGRDDVTGFGVVDFGKLLMVLTSGTQIPAPGGTPEPSPAPAPAPVHSPDPDDVALAAAQRHWQAAKEAKGLL